MTCQFNTLKNTTKFYAEICYYGMPTGPKKCSETITKMCASDLAAKQKNKMFLSHCSCSFALLAFHMLHPRSELTFSHFLVKINAVMITDW